jgi:DNA-binding transcriptional MerR regulator
MSAPTRTVPTVGEIARRLDQPVHRIEYVIRSRLLRPTGRAGQVRIFTEEDVAFIAGQLQQIDARQGRDDTPEPERRPSS